MKIKFYFSCDEDRVLFHNCMCLENPERDPLSAYLRDNEGDKSYASYIGFLKKSLEILNNYNVDSYDLSSNSWSFYLNKNVVEICFLYNEDNTDYQLTLDREKVAFIIRKWIEFLKKEPIEGYEEIIEV